MLRQPLGFAAVLIAAWAAAGAGLASTRAARVQIAFSDSQRGRASPASPRSMGVLVCVTGKLKVSGTTIASTKDQDLQILTQSVGSPIYGHEMQVTIVDPDGTATPKAYSDADFGAPFTLHAKKGAKIEVTMQPISDEGASLRDQHMGCPLAMFRKDDCLPNTAPVPCH